MFVIVREDGKYVAMPGSEKSYTNRLEEAQTFSTREKAEASRCPENETVKAVADLTRRPS